MSRTDTLSIEFFLNRLLPLADASRAEGALLLAPIRRGQEDSYFLANRLDGANDKPCRTLPGRDSFLNGIRLDWLGPSPLKEEMMHELGILLLEVAKALSQAEDAKRQAGDLIYPLY